MSRHRAFKLVVLYFVMFLPSLIVAAVIWSAIAPERFYHCWDDAPVLTFIPPFVHPEFSAGQLQDYFILPRRTVYSIWFVFFSAAVIWPAGALAIFIRLWRFYERHGLFRRCTN